MLYLNVMKKQERGLVWKFSGEAEVNKFKVADAIFSVTIYKPATDMGTNEKDMQVIFDFFSKKNGDYKHMRGGAGRPPDKGGIPIDEWGLTSHGIFAAVNTLENLENNWKICGSKVVIQGYGNVGSPLATKLSQAGAVIVGASDINA